MNTLVCAKTRIGKCSFTSNSGIHQRAIITMGRRSKKYKPNYEEILLVNLKKLIEKGSPSEDQKEKAQSLIRWYMANHFFTPAQMKLGKALTVKKIIKKNKSKQFVYAISDGTNIKLGMSNNVGERLKALQTSNSNKLTIAWKYFVSYDPQGARDAEKLLHKACLKYAIRGEWFKPECMEIVKSFDHRKVKGHIQWSKAKLFTVDKRRKNGIFNFTVEDINRNMLTKDMQRVWNDNTDELYSIEIKKYLEDGEVVLIIIA